MQRILFVDDDLHLLDGLRRRLLGLRDVWDMVFAGDPAAALRACDQCPFDLVVCDLRMRDGSGVLLLTTIARRWPTSARVVLSGISSIPISSELARIAHQFLTKPGSPGQLEDVIDRIGAARRTIPRRRLGELVGDAARLPAFPDSYRALVAALGSPTPQIQTVTGIVASDPALAAKVLQLVNSDFFGPWRDVVGIEHAVRLLGVRLLASLALDFDVFGSLDGYEPAADVDPAEEQRHAVQVARLARHLAPDPAVGDAAYAAGLLHDIGRIQLTATVPTESALVRELSRSGRVPSHQAEQSVFDTTHAAVGGYLLALWGLPAAISDAVRDHHLTRGVDSSSLGRVVHTADTMAHDAKDRRGGLPPWRSQPAESDESRFNGTGRRPLAQTNPALDGGRH